MTETGILDIHSHHSVSETIDRLTALATTRGLLIFARIDFAADAARAGLSLLPMQLLLFGDPKAGTPLLAASPRVGLDLPLKALAWQDEDNQVWISLNSPAYIAVRHPGTRELIEKISGAQALIERAAGLSG